MFVAIGRIVGTHGLRGDVKVESFSGEFGHFDSLERVSLRKGAEEREVAIVGSKRSGGKLVLTLEGVDRVEAAAELRGWELWAPRDEAAPLGEQEYYIADLIGLDVRYGSESFGTISAVYDGGQGELLEVDLGDRRALVPFLEIYVSDVDLERGVLELAERWILE